MLLTDRRRGKARWREIEARDGNSKGWEVWMKLRDVSIEKGEDWKVRKRLRG